MKTLLPPKPHSKVSRKVARYPRHFLAVCLTLAGLILAAASINAALNHPPFISWLPDQRIMGGGFATKYFRILDYDGNTFSITKQSTISTFYSATNVTVNPCIIGGDAGCAQDGTGYKVFFNVNPVTPGTTTIRIRAQDNGTGALSGYTSFTLRLDSSGSNPPSIGSLPNQAIQLPSATGSATYTTKFVIGDLDEAQNSMEDIEGIGVEDFTVSSSNPNVLLDTGLGLALVPPDDGFSIMEGPRTYLLTATTVAGATGTTTVTVNLTDPDGNTTSTSFVLQVVAFTDSPPSITNAAAQTKYVLCPVPTPPTLPVYNYTVASNDSTSVQDLKVTATSSNTNLVPNDPTHLSCSTPAPGGSGTVAITPMLPLPSPSPGVPQTSTITLSVTDDAYTRQTTFLYVAAPQSAAATSHSRPSGVYLLDPNLSQHRPLDLFLTGEMHRIKWNDLERTPDQFNWSAIDDAVDDIPNGQDLSLNLTGEPCYIAASGNLEFSPWCDTNTPAQEADCGATTPCLNGVLRAVPWDSYLRARRDNFLQMLAQHLISTGGITKISIINTNLPGGDAGIRNVSVNFVDMDGYSRVALLGAVQDELRTVQDNFPGKLVQIGFFKATDDNSGYNDELWEWLYRNASSSIGANGVALVALADEFNGVKRPRVSFFQEDLAATRTSDTVSRSNAPNYVTPPLTTSYTFTPNSPQLPSFAYWADLGDPYNPAIYNNGITFQANTPWASPFMQSDGQKLIKTINGSPNDGMEAAFNAYLSQYLEVYPQDADQAQPLSGPPTLNAVLWQGQLRSWHDYTNYLRGLAPIEGPAGLTVARIAANSNTVSWYAVYGATSYSVERTALPTVNWQSVTGCTSLATTQCVDGSTQGTAYAYRVKASLPHSSAYANVAVLLSDPPVNDGYVNATPHNNDPQPGIRAGQSGGAEMKGFLSFATNKLPSSAAVLSAKLRLRQKTVDPNPSAGICKVDIKKGTFGNPSLQATDFSAPASHVNVTQVAFVGVDNWVEAELQPQPIYLSDINLGGITQFRLYLASVAGEPEAVWTGWYSGESVADNPSNPPLLIVRYQ